MSTVIISKKYVTGIKLTWYLRCLILENKLIQEKAKDTIYNWFYKYLVCLVIKPYLSFPRWSSSGLGKYRPAWDSGNKSNRERGWKSDPDLKREKKSGTIFSQKTF